MWGSTEVWKPDKKWNQRSEKTCTPPERIYDYIAMREAHNARGLTRMTMILSAIHLVTLLSLIKDTIFSLSDKFH